MIVGDLRAQLRANPLVRGLHRSATTLVRKLPPPAYGYESKPSGPYSTASAVPQERALQKWSHYALYYDRILESLQKSRNNAALGVIEIGVLHGGSLEVLSRAVPPQSVIIGVDKDPRCSQVSIPGAAVRIGSQSDADFLTGIVKELPSLDLVIDDGSHRAKDQMASLDTLFPYLAPGGFYIIEDIHTSYMAAFGGGWRRPGTAASAAKVLIDGLHSPFHRFGWACGHRATWSELSSITVAESLLILEKRPSDYSCFPFLTDGEKLY